MDERGPEWWLDENRHWRQGTPPTGWHQGADGRWRPAWNDPTEELRTAEAPRHAAARPAGDRRRPAVPQWARIGGGALGAAIVLVVALVLALGSRGTNHDRADSDGGPPAAGDIASTTSITSASSTSSSTDEPTSSLPSTTTSTPPKPGKHGPPSTEPGPDGPDPLALCSPGQRSLIERGNHPPEWYAARFDADGDGIYCE